MNLRLPGVAAVVISVAAACHALGQEASWPDMTQPARAVGGGEADAAVVVGIEGYAFVAPVAGAESNAKAWYDYFTKTRGVPVGKVKLLTGVDATSDEMLDAARKAAGRAGPEGALWFVFIGHGAPAADGKDGLLVGVDAQQKARSLDLRSLRRLELLKALSESRAGSIRVVIDACFSGRARDGSMIAPNLQPMVLVAASGPADPRVAVLTAAKADQFAGALPGAGRPAFSYLVLGGLRGWAGKARVTAGDLWRYASDALEATLRGRNQTPELTGKEETVFGAAPGEKGPDLAALAKATAGAGAREEMFRVSVLPAVPRAQAPAAIRDLAGGADFRSLDIPGLKKFNEATLFDKSSASAGDKAAKWRELAGSTPAFADKALARAAEWGRYAGELAAAEDARRKREEARDADWEKLSELLPLEVVQPQDKRRWAQMFVDAYGKAEEDNPYVGDLAGFLPAGTVKASPAGGIRWVRIPAGSFMMGDREWSNSKPVHRVTVKSFQMSKTEATNKQYKACVEAGACTPPSSYEGGDDQPVVNVDWNQARTFSEWVGGRLPSEAEWEYAARSAGKDRKYPWGDEEPLCERAVMNQGGNGCGRNSTWPVCSKTAGNTEQGLCDMAGNVWEWTQDWYHDSYNGAPSDGSAWESPAGSGRVGRGGSWSNDVAGVFRAAGRDGGGPGGRSADLGLRVAR
ncbi:MAG: formylglycine-generating enzyme family protein [Elusimicrobia bacterium]|nr:formylglycine-generating enzyme family protein [Elusimicrobiota bacterium]